MSSFSTSLISAHIALTPAVFFGFIRMSFWAVLFSSVICGRRKSAPVVFYGQNSLHVAWVNALSISAKVINLFTLRNSAYEKGETHPMGQHRLGFHKRFFIFSGDELSIPVGPYGALPFPAPFNFSRILQKPGFKGRYLGVFHAIALKPQSLKSKYIQGVTYKPA